MLSELLTRQLPASEGAACYRRIFEVQRLAAPQSSVPQSLSTKYGVPSDGAQEIVSVRQRFSGALTLWNPARTAKPQSFTAASVEDPTLGRSCDFCNWNSLTAADSFGRVELEHAVSASNLFKFTRHHGLVLFKHHEPLQFSEPQLADLLCCGEQWALATAAAHADAAAGSATLLWNALPRSGASQFHGHAQVVVTPHPLPEQEREAAAARAYEAAHPERCGLYAADVGAAHAALGLSRRLRMAGSVAQAYASIAPFKDCEVTVAGASVTCPAFVRLLHIALRALLDRRGVTAFNAAVAGLRLSADVLSGGVQARIVSRGRAASAASDFGALEVFGGASIGHTDPWTVMGALDAELESRGCAWDRL